MALTTIAIETTVRDKLKSIGRKGETYSQLIDRLVDSETLKYRCHDVDEFYKE